jgi:hypothetical protein
MAFSFPKLLGFTLGCICIVNSVFSDEYECDNTPAEAKPISINNAAQQRDIGSYDDVDWIYFDGIKGNTYSVLTDADGGNGPCWPLNVTIFAASNLNVPLPGNTWECTADQRYYIKAIGASCAGYVQTPTYTVRVVPWDPNSYFDRYRTYKIVSRYSGRALDVTDWNPADGAKIQQWDYCNQTNQQWRIISLGNNVYKIINVFSNKALDVTDWATWDGASIQQWSYNYQNNQRWLIFPGIDGISYFRIRSVHSNKVLDVKDWGAQNGTPMQQWTDMYTQTNQEWAIVSVQ